MLRTSGFVDDVIFSHNGASRKESKTTHTFRRVRQLTAPMCLIVPNFVPIGQTAADT